MRYHVLACDFDGTLAWDGVVNPNTLTALERARASGRKIVLVTGRILDDLAALFPQLDLFDRVVAEDGAVLYEPVSGELRILGEPPPRAFIEALRARNIGPIAVGNVIVSTWQPHEAAVLEAIDAAGLEHHIVFNKGAVMVLPPGVNKATGLTAAVHDLQLSMRNTVCIGDAENDYAMFKASEFSVAVANALPQVKCHADHVTSTDHGAGVAELVDMLMATDLEYMSRQVTRRNIVLGWQADGTMIHLHPAGSAVLILGSAGSGKSYFTAGILQSIIEQGYQVLALDPEGNYVQVPGFVHLGSAQETPSVAQIMNVLGSPTQSVVVNLLGLPMANRPSFFGALYPAIMSLRNAVGRPHWLVVDEAHHLLPAMTDPAVQLLPKGSDSLALVTANPWHIPPGAVESADAVLVLGDRADVTLQEYARAVGKTVPQRPKFRAKHGYALAWLPREWDAPLLIRCARTAAKHRRHQRKYMEGDMGPERSFYFRGPNRAIQVQAKNLASFLDIAECVDDDIWTFHLSRGDFSNWIAGTLGDEELANALHVIERDHSLNARESRNQVRSAIESRYTLPA